MLDTHLHWARQPMYARLVVLYLVVACSIAVVRFLRLAWSLYSSPGRKRIALQDVHSGDIEADLLAESALANRIQVPHRAAERGNREGKAHREHRKAVLRTVEAAEERFLYLWQMCESRVQSIKRTALLILLLSFLTVAHNAYPTFLDQCYETNLSGQVCLFRVLEQISLQLTFGLTICAILYAGAIFFEGALHRRMACWRYFCARLKHELPNEQHAL